METCTNPDLILILAAYLIGLFSAFYVCYLKREVLIAVFENVDKFADGLRKSSAEMKARMDAAKKAQEEAQKKKTEFGKLPDAPIDGKFDKILKDGE